MCGYSFVTLTEGNSKEFTRSQIEGARTAQELHKRMEHSGYKKFLWLIKNNKIKDCVISLEDAKCALHLFDPSVGVVRGRSVKQKQHPIRRPTVIDLPKEVTA